MTPEQCRAARELLGWSRNQLGTVSGTSAHLVRYFEEFGRAAPPRKEGEHGGDRLQGVRAALEAAGIEFTKGDEPSVKLGKASD